VDNLVLVANGRWQYVANAVTLALDKFIEESRITLPVKVLVFGNGGDDDLLLYFEITATPSIRNVSFFYPGDPQNKLPLRITVTEIVGAVGGRIESWDLTAFPTV